MTIACCSRDCRYSIKIISAEDGENANGGQAVYAPAASVGSCLPCFVFDEAGIERTARDVCRSFSWNRGYRQYFPVRVLPNPGVLRVLHRSGMGVVCGNRLELLLAQRAGFAGHEMLYAPVIVTPEAAVLAAELDCQLLLDSENQVMGMERYRRLPQTVGLRYNPDERLTSGRHTLARTGEQGLGMHKQSLYKTVAVLKSKGVNSIGLHIHMADRDSGGQCMLAAAHLLLELAADVRKRYGVNIAYCDVSGNVGISRSPVEPAPDMVQLSRSLERCWQKLPASAGLSDVPLHTQLGDYVVGMHGLFAARICDVKDRRWRFLGIDATLAQLSREFSAAGGYPVRLLRRGSSSVSRFYHAYGAAVSVADRLMSHQFLPTAEIGDILVMERMGANVGDLPCAEYLYTKNGDLRLIRRSLCPEDYFATLV